MPPPTNLPSMSKSTVGGSESVLPGQQSANATGQASASQQPVSTMSGVNMSGSGEAMSLTIAAVVSGGSSAAVQTNSISNQSWPTPSAASHTEMASPMSANQQRHLIDLTEASGSYKSYSNTTKWGQNVSLPIRFLNHIEEVNFSCDFVWIEGISEFDRRGRSATTAASGHEAKDNDGQSAVSLNRTNIERQRTGIHAFTRGSIDQQ